MNDKLEQAIKLLELAEETLRNYWFDESGEINNDDAIEATEKIEKFLEELKNG